MSFLESIMSVLIVILGVSLGVGVMISIVYMYPTYKILSILCGGIYCILLIASAVYLGQDE